MARHPAYAVLDADGQLVGYAESRTAAERLAAARGGDLALAAHEGRGRYRLDPPNEANRWTD